MERSILENMVFAFMVGELGIEPITARKEVEKMTDEQLENLLISRNAPILERPPRDGLPVLMMADQKGKKYEIHNQDQWKKV